MRRTLVDTQLLPGSAGIGFGGVTASGDLYGIAIVARRNWADDQYYWRVTQFLMPSYTLIPSEPGAPISFTGAVPVDDTNMVGFTVTWMPDQPLAEEHIRRIESWAGIYAEVDPLTFEPIFKERIWGGQFNLKKTVDVAAPAYLQAGARFRRQEPQQFFERPTYNYVGARGAAIARFIDQSYTYQPVALRGTMPSTRFFDIPKIVYELKNAPASFTGRGLLSAEPDQLSPAATTDKRLGLGYRGVIVRRIKPDEGAWDTAMAASRSPLAAGRIAAVSSRPRATRRARSGCTRQCPWREPCGSARRSSSCRRTSRGTRRRQVPCSRFFAR